jgi:hypothetical protein
MQTPSENSIVPIGLITQKIYFVCSVRVMLDANLARLYGVATKNLNKAVKRNMRRFPQDFMFQLSPNEMRNLRFRLEPQGERKAGAGMLLMHSRSKALLCSRACCGVRAPCK